MLCEGLIVRNRSKSIDSIGQKARAAKRTSSGIPEFHGQNYGFGEGSLFLATGVAVTSTVVGTTFKTVNPSGWRTSCGLI
jgi:hypothetical protein